MTVTITNQTKNTTATLSNQTKLANDFELLTESGATILLENGGSLLLEGNTTYYVSVSNQNKS